MRKLKVIIVLHLCFILHAKGQVIDGGVYHSVLLCKSGEVYTVGENRLGQRGMPIADTTYLFDPIPSVNDIVQVEAGAFHTMALRKDSTVWAWGSNDEGQLLNGNLGTLEFQPQKIDSLGKVVQVSAGEWNSFFLMEDSTVFCGGGNSYGELGFTGPPFRVSRPRKIQGLSEVVKVSTMYGHVLALKANGEVWALGSNGLGELGVGNRLDSSVPLQVLLLSNVIDISAGTESSYALTANGEVWAWGSNRKGELGNGTPISINSYSSQPVNLGLDSIVNVKAGQFFALALKMDGTVWAWGANLYGQLGDSTGVDRNIPLKVKGLSNIVNIGTGTGCGYAIDSAGVVYSWGVGLALATDTLVEKLMATPITPMACSPAISINEPKLVKQEVKVYPNPTTGMVSLEVSGGGQIKGIEVFNTMGLSVMKQMRPTNRIDISTLPKGIYFLKIETQDGVVLRKVMKE